MTHYDRIIQWLSEYHNLHLDDMLADGALDDAIEGFIKTLTELKGE